MSKPTIHVAIAILLHQGKVLVGWREANQHQGNKHEFPGGKVEEGETPLAACRREIYEEVGVGLQDWHTFDVIRHEYDDVIVNLHLFHAIVPTALLNEIQHSDESDEHSLDEQFKLLIASLNTINEKEFLV